MKIFITGGTGFIGTHLIKRLKQSNHQLCILLLESEQLPHGFSNDIKIISGNLSNIDSWKDKLSKFYPDITIHMAWQDIPDYSYKTSILNLKNSLDLFLTVAEIGCKKILSTGTCWEYGRKKGMLSEDMQPFINNPFTAAKNSLQIMGNEIAKENDITFIWTRLFYVYGPLQRSYSLIPHIISSISKQEKLDIKSPWTKNDFIFVSDVADALERILEKCDKSNIYNIGSGKSISVNDIVKNVCDRYNYPYESNQDKTPDENIDFWADISKIKKDFKWKPKIQINEGIDETIKYYDNLSKNKQIIIR